jgi:phosphopentomutase
VRRLRALPCLGRELARIGLPSQIVTGQLDPVTWALVAGLAAAAGIGRLTGEGTAARDVAWRALREAGSQSDGVLFVYLTDCDRAGHADGWMSAAYRAAAGEVDAAVGRLSVLAADSLLLVLADHGGGGVTPTDHDAPHPDNDRIPLVFAGPGVARRREVTREVSLLDVPPTVLARLGIAVPPAYPGRPLDEAFAQPDATEPEKVAA